MGAGLMGGLTLARQEVAEAVVPDILILPPEAERKFGFTEVITMLGLAAWAAAGNAGITKTRLRTESDDMRAAYRTK